MELVAMRETIRKSADAEDLLPPHPRQHEPVDVLVCSSLCVGNALHTTLPVALPVADLFTVLAYYCG